MSNIIVGGGITGLFMAYTLIKADPTMHRYITILEKTKRLGGRISTKSHKGLRYDIGAARFSRNHTLLIKLIHDLGLGRNILKISNTSSYYINNTTIPDQASLLKYYKIARFSSIKEIWEYIFNKVATIKKTTLQKTTVYSVLVDILTSSEVDLITQAFLYNTKLYYSNAYTTFNSIYYDYDILKEDMYILVGGMEQIITALYNNLVKSGVTILSEHDVIKINKKSLLIRHESSTYSINYEKLFMCVTNFDILSLPIAGLSKKTIQTSISTGGLMRIYARYPLVNNKPWFKGMSKILTDNQLQFIIPIDEKTGLIMVSYSTDELATYWNNLGSKQKVQERIGTILKTMFPTIDIPVPDFISIHYWKRGIHYWNPGVDSLMVQNHLKTIPNIYILGEAYSDHQSWIEGGLSSVEKIFIDGRLDTIVRRELTMRHVKDVYEIIDTKLPLITRAELKLHNTSTSLWTSINDRYTHISYVYDLTNWVKLHPGGSSHILSLGGKDGTKKFYSQKAHPIEKIETDILPKYRIGILK